MRFQGTFITAVAIFHFLRIADAIQVSPETFATHPFDFIVVGGGSAGLAVATRLSDNPNVNIGVLEAGVIRLDNDILIPDPNYDWNFTTIPQNRLDGRQLGVHRGKLLGGTSGINGLVHSRASKTEYDGIQTLGNPGWNWDNWQAGMKKSENWTAPSTFLQQKYFANDDAENHGRKGPVQDSVYSFYADVVTPFYKAAQNLKIAINKAMGYYAPNALRANLVVLTGAQVTKILTKNVNGLALATQVEYIAGNKTYTVSVNKEVILSAGTIQTPQVLELSGIGNKTILEALSIPVVVDLPGVGENHHDHFGVSLSFQSLDEYITPDKLKIDSAFAAQQLAQYAQNRTGLYSATSATTLAFLPMQDFVAPAAAASLLSDLDAALPDQPSHLKEQFALQREWLNDPTIPQLEVVLFATLSTGSPQPGKSYYTIALFLQHLWSRGSIHVTTKDPLTAPAIDGNYLNSPGDFDMNLLIEAVKWAQKLSQTEPLKSSTLAVLNPVLNATDDQIKEFITSSGNTEWHFAGTAAMLPRDQNGVVDSELKVYGTSNIRVVDASVLPVHVATHPTLTLYGHVSIAERAAEGLTTGAWQ
ncbi:hypothetical protein H0H92_014912 [Tricholoma furcatifolium]|nr:hypothetical protein H0H92_014912 [Tricholoma furcatifolium]